MAFPQTRHTLIQRLAAGGGDADWRGFLDDYWGPVCRFAMRRRDVGLAEAEDIASQTFEVLLKGDLLGRWASAPQAKLRTLLCQIVIKLQANARRAAFNRERMLQELRDAGAYGAEVSPTQQDAFLAAWVEDMLQHCLHHLALEYHREGRGDYFRVLHGRLCEEMTIAEVAAALEISVANVDNFYRHVRQRLHDKLEAGVRSHAYRYASPDEAESEFAAEWSRLGAYLRDHGGLDDAVRRTYALVEAGQLERRKPQRITETITRLAP